MWPPLSEQVLTIEPFKGHDSQFAGTLTSVMLLGGSHVDRRQFLAASAAVGPAALGDCADGVQSVRVDDSPTGIAARLPSVPGSPYAVEFGERIAARRVRRP